MVSEDFFGKLFINMLMFDVVLLIFKIIVFFKLVK